MRHFRASDIIRTVQRFMGAIVECCDAAGQPLEQHVDYIHAEIGRLRKLCNQLSCTVTREKILDLSGLICNVAIQPSLPDKAQEICDTLEQELRARKFLFVPDERAQLLENQNPFGERVADAFPSAASDIEEAAKCFAMARWTACVFHLTRALEVALVALSHELGASVATNWNNQLNQIDKLLKTGLERPEGMRPEEWRIREEFYAAASAHFRNIKNGIRNGVHHVGAHWDEARALAVFQASEAFLQHLSERISERAT